MDKEVIYIIFLVRNIKTGGERYLDEVYKYFKRNDIKIEAIYVDDFPKWPRRLGLPFDCIVSNIWFFLKVRNFFKMKRITIFEDFHLHPRLFLCNLAIKILGKDVRFVTLVQKALSYRGPRSNALSRMIDGFFIKPFLLQSDAILCNSQFTRDEVKSKIGSVIRTETVYCGYDPRPPSLRARTADGYFHILYVGQCSYVKGLVYLLRALSLLNKKNIILDIAGNCESEKDYYKFLKKMIKELQLEGRIFFQDHVQDGAKLAQLYVDADIFCLPSLYEGFGIVLLEAMSFGLPIVTTTVGSIPELVKDEQNGLLVPPFNAEALAAALRRVMDSSELRYRLGVNGRKFFDSNRNFYSWDKTGERILGALSRLR